MTPLPTMCNWFWKFFNSCSKFVNTNAMLQNSVFNFDRVTLQPNCFAWEYFQKSYSQELL